MANEISKKFKKLLKNCNRLLVEEEPIAVRVLADYISVNGRPTSANECLETFTGLSLQSVSEIIIKDWAVQLPANFRDELLALDQAAFEKDLHAVPTIADAINHIKAAGIKVCVASSGTPEKISNSLAITGLAHLFDDNIFSASNVANGKPAPDLFLSASKTMAVQPANTLVIEDSAAGITAAINAAMAVFGFTGGTHASSGDYEARPKKAGADNYFSTMTQLPKLLGI